jgi:DNA-binding XRE family transcriptional regulator
VPGLRHVRDRAALTQEELARLAGLSRPTISHLETGEGAMHITIRKLCRALKCKPAELLDPPEEK